MAEPQIRSFSDLGMSVEDVARILDQQSQDFSTIEGREVSIIERLNVLKKMDGPLAQRLFIALFSIADQIQEKESEYPSGSDARRRLDHLKKLLLGHAEINKEKDSRWATVIRRLQSRRE